MQRLEASAPFHMPLVVTVSMRALNCGRLLSFTNAGWKSQTAGSTWRVTSPVDELRRSRMTGITSVGAIENDGTQSR